MFCHGIAVAGVQFRCRSMYCAGPANCDFCWMRCRHEAVPTWLWSLYTVPLCIFIFFRASHKKASLCDDCDTKEIVTPAAQRKASQGPTIPVTNMPRRPQCRLLAIVAHGDDCAAAKPSDEDVSLIQRSMWTRYLTGSVLLTHGQRN